MYNVKKNLYKILIKYNYCNIINLEKRNEINGVNDNKC